MRSDYKSDRTRVINKANSRKVQTFREFSVKTSLVVFLRLYVLMSYRVTR